MFKKLEGNYAFIETGKMDEDRIRLGWKMESCPAYVLNYSSDREKCEKAINEADIVIYGSAPENVIAAPLNNGTLVFKYAERIYRGGYEFWKFPVRIIRFYRRFGKYKNLYLLGASAYTYGDYARHFTFINKAYRWGYFPETREYADVERLMRDKKDNSLLWAGRFLNLKHPDAVVRLAKRLRDSEYRFELNIIGTGDMEMQLKEMIDEFGLNDCVHMLGSMKPEQVRKYMEQSQIYLFTSDRNEGWGAVLNESMNSGCTAVASHAIGSVPFLLKDGENGFVYESGDENDLFRKVKYLLDNPSERERMGKNAYRTIVTEWNAEIAAERFIQLSQQILSGEKYPNLFKSGPCSNAEIVKENWLVNEKNQKDITRERN